MNKRDLLALYLSGTYCHRTRTRPPNCVTPRQPTIHSLFNGTFPMKTPAGRKNSASRAIDGRALCQTLRISGQTNNLEKGENPGSISFKKPIDKRLGKR